MDENNNLIKTEKIEIYLRVKRPLKTNHQEKIDELKNKIAMLENEVNGKGAELLNLKDGMKVKRRTQEKTKKIFLCHACQYNSTLKTNLIRHIKNQHTQSEADWLKAKLRGANEQIDFHESCWLLDMKHTAELKTRFEKEMNNLVTDHQKKFMT